MKTDTDTIKRLDEVFKAWNRSDAPGLVIGVAVDGRAIYRRGFGLASVEHGNANTPKTRMRIGSTSKHFTSLATLLLAEQGKLKIDAPVRTYLPELSGPAGEPTPRQLMTHTGGLRDPLDLPGILLHRGYPKMISAGMALEMTPHFQSGNFAPGERMIYCNNGYYLLSRIIERISGETFEGFLKNRLFNPLGMNDTESLPSDMRMIPGIASFHIPQADGSYRRGVYPTEELLGSGAIVSTIDDMLLWLAHLRGEKKIGNKRSWEQMLEKPRYSSGAFSDYCLGLTRESYRGLEIVHHAGATVGCTCQMLTVPAHALDIIIMSNRMDSNPSALALKVIEAVLGDAALAAATPPLPAQEYEALVGRWYSPLSHRVFGVVAHPPAPDKPPVLALSIHHQVMGLLKKSEAGLSMDSPAHGSVELRLPKALGKKTKTLEISDSGHCERYVRLAQKAPTAQQLSKNLIGRYRYADFEIEVAVTFADGALYLDLLAAYGHSRLKLEPWSDEVFGCTLISSSAIPLPSLATLTVERKAGKVRGLWLNNTRTRNLWLERCH